MATPFTIPPIPTILPEETTPLVLQLLAIIDALVGGYRQQAEDLQHMRDEIAILKGEKPKPTLQPSALDKHTDDDDTAEDDTRRPGSDKRKKTATLTIHEECIVQPKEPIPTGSVFKGYRDYTVQDLRIEPHTIRYRLAVWLTPDGTLLSGTAPQTGHFGNTLKSYILYQHHQCHVTQPLLLEQLREWGVDIAAGSIQAILTEQEESLTEEKEAILAIGLATSPYVTVDDSGARHRGENGYVLNVGNPHFSWFKSTSSKSKINFLECLRAGHHDYVLSEELIPYMENAKLGHTYIRRLFEHPARVFPDAEAWDAHLTALGFDERFHGRVATEAALIGSLLHHGFRKDLAIVSDDAGQFNVFLHGLCWIHAERLVHKLIPFTQLHRGEVERVRDQIWALYRELKQYKKNPILEKRNEISASFDTIFTQNTPYETLQSTLRRIYRNKEELLLVLEYPSVPLHTNGSETDIRDYVKKRKVSGGTRSDVGQRCRDTFTSLKKTCRKQGISFWAFLCDRTAGAGVIPLLSESVRQSMQQGAMGY